MHGVVHAPTKAIDDESLEEFRGVVDGLVRRHRAVVIDCTDVSMINPSGMRVLQRAARLVDVRLVNTSSAVRLLAAVYGLSVELGRVGGPARDALGEDR
jgi:anti-anti-sigma regulatory factor